jgi:hypothetical protein
VYIKYHRKKDQKYEGKVDPIYEIKKSSQQYESFFTIQKYKLEWERKLWIWFYPTYIYTWKYVLVKEIIIGREKHLITLNKTLSEMTLKDYFENKIKEEQEMLEKLKKDENNIDNILNSHNKEFKENFVN